MIMEHRTFGYYNPHFNRHYSRLRHPDQNFQYDYDLMSSAFLHGSVPEVLSTSTAKIWSGIFVLVITVFTIILVLVPIQTPEQPSETQAIQVVESVKK